MKERLPTTSFALLLRQEGEGCDYTIGCGLKVVPLNETTVEAARVEAEGLFKNREFKFYEETSDESTDAVEEAVIIRMVGSIADNVRAWMREEAQLQARGAQASTEAGERSMLGRLLAKYGGK